MNRAVRLIVCVGIFVVSCLCGACGWAQEQRMVVIVDKDIDGNAVQTDNPLGIDFDAQGKMYIGELAGGRVLRRDVDGTLAVIAGDGSRGYAGDGGPAGKATFDGIHNVAVTPEGDIYVSDAWNHCVRKISASTGAIETFAGTGTAGYRGDDGPATEAMFDFVMCVSFSPDYKQLFLADLKNRRVRAIDMETKIVRTIAGNGQKGVPADGDIATESPLIDPRAVAVDDAGHVYILERSGHALRVVRPDGTIVTVAGTGKKGAQDGHALDASFNSPKHLSIAGDGKVFIADDGNNIIRVYDPSTQTVSSIRTKQQLRRPHGVCIGSDGTLFVVDSWNDRILKTLVQ